MQTSFGIPVTCHCTIYRPAVIDLVQIVQYNFTGIWLGLRPRHLGVNVQVKFICLRCVVLFTPYKPVVTAV
jgi:hypothetical protein